MSLFILIFEIIGTVAFAISGAMTGLKKNMDVFGVCILGLTTAVGGGIIRDLILGVTPPSAFCDPTNALLALGVSLVFFIPALRRKLFARAKIFDQLLLLTDSAGLGIFTVCGARVAISAGYGENFFLTIFLAVLTGVGGGVIRDLFAGDRPYIFVKHIYACAALAGGIICTILWRLIGESASMLIGFAVVVVIRLLAAHFHWSLPKAHDVYDFNNE